MSSEHQIAGPEGSRAAAVDAVVDLLMGAALTPERVAAAELATLELPQVSCPVVHRFGPGIYIREVFMPADTFAIGHEQRFEQYNIFLQGRVTVFREDGSRVDMVAPMAFVGPPGRKVGYVHEDTVWMNVYATTETDVGKLEATFLNKSEGWSLHEAQLRAMRELEHEGDRADFSAALAELGAKPSQVRTQSEDEADQIPFPHGGYKVRTAPSPIEGTGLFATADIAPGEVIAPARLGGKRTPAGRYTNHARRPNARMFALANGDIVLIALRQIRGAAGGDDGEEITVDYRQAVAENLKTV